MTSSNSQVNGTNKKALLAGNAFLKSLKWVLPILLVLIVLIFFIFLNHPTYVLQIEKVETGEILWESEIEKEEWFAHEYIHSVEKSPVIEKFKFDKSGEILTMESWTKSFGAGLPYERKGTVDMIDGYFVIKDLNRPIHGGSLMMQPSDLFPHKFYFQDEELMLSEAPFVKNAIEIKVVEMNGFQSLVHLF